MKKYIVLMACALLFAGAYLSLSGKITAIASQDKFFLQALPYPYNALEPAIDATTMEIHHTKHHQGYINNLNAEVAKNPILKGLSLKNILADIENHGDTVRNNAGGHWNHSFFWAIMSPPQKSGEPSPDLEKNLRITFGGMDEFKKAFEQAGLAQFGSGWVWLIVNASGKLEIVSTPNQDNPLMGDATIKGTPLLGNDLWEHAYYLQYQNKRGAYLSNWWQVVNWNRVSELYADAMAKKN